MHVLQINSVYSNGSTGKIVENIHNFLLSKHASSSVIFSRSNAYGSKKKSERKEDNVYYISNKCEEYRHLLKGVLLDKHGLYSKKNTQKIIDKIKELNPDIIHLHNIHGFYLNYPLFFSFLRQYGKPVLWTVHDCWAFTGFCSHYEYNGCSEWRKGCKKCLYKNVYPYRVLSNSKKNYEMKKYYFNLIQEMIIITPSKWIKEQLLHSFLSNKKTVVIHNTINTNVFKRINITNILKNHDINKKVILAVSNGWTKGKGFDEYIKLSKLLSEDWIIVMIGVSKKQKTKLPLNIVGIEKTTSLSVLIEWYSAATCFVNLTLEDTYPTVNIEALSCGLPVITYNTGGSPEMLSDSACVVDKYDLNAVVDLLETYNFLEIEMNFKNDMPERYFDLYMKVMSRERFIV